MKKVMLIYDDLSESDKAQNLLKKIGFDVLVMSSLQRLSDQILTFNPDLVIANAHKKFKSIEVGVKLREISHFRGKSILALPYGVRPEPKELTQARIDAIIELPLSSEKLIQIIAKTLKLNVEPMLEKFKKAKVSDLSTANEKIFAVGGKIEEPQSIHVRGASEKSAAQNIKGAQTKESEIQVRGKLENESGVGDFPKVENTNPSENEISFFGSESTIEDSPLKEDSIEQSQQQEYFKESTSTDLPLNSQIRNELLKKQIDQFKEKFDNLLEGKILNATESEFKKAEEKIPLQDKVRSSGYQKYISSMNIDKKETSITRQAIKANLASAKNELNEDLLNDLHDLKKQFVKALFKK